MPMPAHVHNHMLPPPTTLPAALHPLAPPPLVGCRLVVMAFDAVGPDMVFALMAALFMAIGIIDVKAGAAGFSNTGVLTVVVL